MNAPTQSQQTGNPVQNRQNSPDLSFLFLSDSQNQQTADPSNLQQSQQQWPPQHSHTNLSNQFAPSNNSPFVANPVQQSQQSHSQQQQSMNRQSHNPQNDPNVSNFSQQQQQRQHSNFNSAYHYKHPFQQYMIPSQFHYQQQVMNQPVDLRYIASLSEQVLLDSGNLAWRNCIKTIERLENERFALKHQLEQQNHNYTELVKTLNPRPPSSTSSSSNPSFALHVSYPPVEPLDPDHYKAVKNWNRPRKTKAHSKCVIVTDPSEISGDTVDGPTRDPTPSDSDDDDSEYVKTHPKKELGVPAFLVGTDGKILSIAYKEEIYSSARGFFNEHVDPNNVPINYSSSGETLRQNFRNFMENKFKPLRLCSSHWKANLVFSRLYHSWLKTYRGRMAKQGHEIKVIEKKKRKRKASDDEEEEDDDGDDEEEEAEEEPQRKKKKQTEKPAKTSQAKGKGKKQVTVNPQPKTARDAKKKKAKPILQDSVVQPQCADPLAGISVNLDRDNRPRSVSPLRRVDPQDVELLNQFHEKVKGLPKSVPKATSTHPLAPLNATPADQVAAVPADTDLWEYFDRELNILIPHEKDKLRSLVVRGKHGLIGLANLVEHLVTDCGIMGGLLQGKLERIMTAIDEVLSENKTTDRSTGKPIKKKVQDSSNGEPTRAQPRRARWTIPEEITPQWECARAFVKGNENATKADFTEHWREVLANPTEHKRWIGVAEQLLKLFDSALDGTGKGDLVAEGTSRSGIGEKGTSKPKKKKAKGE